MTATAQLGDTEVIAALQEARQRTLQLVSRISDADLEAVHSTLMSPLAWDLGHIAAFEDLWVCHRYGGRPLLHEELADVYDAFETPRADRGELEFLDSGAAREYLSDVRGRTLEVIDARGAGDQVGDRDSQASHSDLDSHASHSDLGVICDLILRHEYQHTETMLQTMQLAGLRGFELDGRGRRLRAADDAPAPTGLEFVRVAGGPCTIGAPAPGFAYDNVRSRHERDVPAFAIARTPVTNRAYGEFVADGGYERRELWSDEGWAWRTREHVTRPGGWSADLRSESRLGHAEPLDPDRPVIHVSCFEAEAFARAHEARLPTEREWEKAATWDARAGRARTYPWGEAAPVPGVHAILDQLSGGTAVAGSLPAGASPAGCEQMIGDVWEWTSTEFGGYPGFRPFPYREYSEVFFASGYRVLRGGSWATRPKVATATFRNWDLPQRRQIFSGLRLAFDV
jgi:iron(II)-dependent oxidoreductase